MEHGRFYDETAVKAERIETRIVEVETPEGRKASIRIRAALLPPNFQLVEPDQYGIKGGKTNKRWPIMREHNGIQVCRQRRQIDCIAPPWTKFQLYDANLKIEIDFDPELDEEFGITTSKQQIVIDDEMWQRIRHSGSNGGGLGNLIRDIRGRLDTLRAELKARSSNAAVGDGPRPSEVAMAISEKFKGAVTEPTSEQQTEAQENLEKKARERAKETGLPEPQVLQTLTEQTKKKKWEVEFSSIPEGPFYRPERLGEQKRLVINTDHPFHSKVYEAAPEVQAALEVLLFVLAERELESKKDLYTFYKAERQRWSERLRYALDTLPDDTLVNRAAAIAEHLFDSGGVVPEEEPEVL